MAGLLCTHADGLDLQVNFLLARIQHVFQAGGIGPGGFLAALALVLQLAFGLNLLLDQIGILQAEVERPRRTGCRRLVGVLGVDAGGHGFHLLAFALGQILVAGRIRPFDPFVEQVLRGQVFLGALLCIGEILRGLAIGVGAILREPRLERIVSRDLACCFLLVLLVVIRLDGGIGAGLGIGQILGVVGLVLQVQAVSATGRRILLEVLIGDRRGIGLALQTAERRSARGCTSARRSRRTSSGSRTAT